MVQLDIDSLLSLTGDLKDGEESQGKFRNFLSKEDLTLQDLESWINDCLESTGSNYNRALQDIINAIGERLGFSVDYGFYQGRQGEIGYDGVWAYPDENVKLVIETKKTTANEIDTNQVVDYIQELEAASDTEENVYGLFVIGKDNINTVVNTIRGSPHRGSLRIVPVPKLLTLLDLKQKASLRDEQIVKLLLPLNKLLLPLIFFDYLQKYSKMDQIELGEELRRAYRAGEELAKLYGIQQEHLLRWENALKSKEAQKGEKK